MSSADDLHVRVGQFQRMELPGQPMVMHTGTLYLVNELYREVLRQRDMIEQMQQRIEAEERRCADLERAVLA